MTKNKISINKIRIYILIYLAITGCWAVCMGDTTLNRPFFVPVLPYLGYVIDLIFIIFLRKRNIGNSDICLVFVPIIALVVFNINVYDRNNYSPNVLFFLHLIVFALTTDNEKKSSYKVIRAIFIVSSVLGIFAFLSFQLKIGLPFSQVPYYDDDPNTYYIDYKFAYLYYEEGFGFCRLCGFVNEPGLFGTLISFLLIADNFDIKKKENMLLLIAAILSFSTAFYIIVFTYLFFRYVKSKKMIIVLLLAFAGLIYIIIAESDNEIISAMTVAKFKDGLSGVRTNADFDMAMDKMIERGDILWGYGNGFTRGASYKVIILNFGIIGMIILYLPLIWVALMKAAGNKQAWILITCFLLSIFQRPHVFNPIYFLILFGGIEYIKNKNNVVKTQVQPYLHTKEI